MSGLIDLSNKQFLKIRVEEYKEFEKSMFKNTYINALKCVKDIIDGNSNLKGSNIDVTNNIVAFIGERGSGKTSAMTSFSKFLIEAKKLMRDHELNGEFEQQYRDTIIENANLEIMPVIDPSIFNENDSIIEIIIATIFKDFKKSINPNEFDSQHRELIRQFANVYKNLKTIHNNKNDIYGSEYDDVEILCDLASSVDLKENIQELVSQYLKIKNKKDGFLVIQIDDLDLSLKFGQQMLEDIRKYLFCKNIIILISLKIEQMKSVIKEKFIYELQNTKNENLNKIDNIVNMYIEKLIPLNRRLIMPSILDKSYDLIIEKNEERKFNVQDRIIKLIYDNTGFLMNKPDFGTNKLMPKTLRELNMFISYCNNFKKIESELSIDNLKENISLLKHYYTEIWSQDNFDYEKNSFIKDIIISDSNEINRKIIFFIITQILSFKGKDKFQIDRELTTYIKDFREEMKTTKENKYTKIEELLNNSNSDLNVSMADVIMAITLGETYFTEESDKRFLEFIKFLYSLIIYENFNICYFTKGNEIEKANDLMKIFISGDIYANLHQIRDLNNPLHNMMGTDVKMEFYNIKGGKNSKPISKKYIQSEDDINILNSFLISLFLIQNPNDDGKTLKNRERKWWDSLIYYRKQKNFIFSPAYFITRIFYQDVILKSMFDEENSKYEEVKNQVKNLPLKQYLDKNDEWFKNNIYNSLFYNIDYLQYMAVKEYNESSKKRGIIAKDYAQGIESFIKCFEVTHEEYIERYESIIGNKYYIYENLYIYMPIFDEIKDKESKNNFYNFVSDNLITNEQQEKIKNIEELKDRLRNYIKHIRSKTKNEDIKKRIREMITEDEFIEILLNLEEIIEENLEDTNSQLKQKLVLYIESI